MKKKMTKDFDFSKRAVSYDNGVEGKASQRFYNLLLHEVVLQPGAKLLDVGCGTGALLHRFAEKFDMAGYGTDIEEAMIDEARKNCPQMQLAIASCDHLPFEDQAFDAVIACMAYHHFGNKEGFAKEAARLLKPSGILYIADPRFPWIIRKALHGILRILRVVGHFSTPKELAAQFAGHGFTPIGTAVDGYAQVVKLQKTAL
jgi:ubiquinone/menaquinone biosynthesis C-methylase UbiE